MGKRKQAKIDKITADIERNFIRIEELGAKLVAFGGSKDTRTKLLHSYARAIVLNEELQEKRAQLGLPWFARNI